ncbi:SDR family NAD(P)-dependent oxidoreductase [Actinomadura rudentiformis]|uniref:SDR family NAD(P)-dependent oxidoreductase n=1 Tax=Actinomadura rudentiformis TaxID=359158 RepID=A0A6H9YVA8_9ACTN|nr:SDR family NAD(P)-dependent oxidoreductase [Actinomadura rudentiformis]KAB2351019.1 SDR family NAD(P)-dependent oxidoreductase [Actinomadura rudentiformis]
MTRKTALITGASRGLGRALAQELGRDGWNLILNARGAEALDAASAEILEAASKELAPGDGPAARNGQAPVAITTIAGDVADPDHRARLVQAVNEAGGLDLLVNNAGTLGTTPLPRLADQPLDELAEAFRINTLAPLALVQALLPTLRERGGAILNITSDASREPYETWGGYGSTKAALEQISNVLAAEEPEVAVWWVDPGEMRTEMLRAAGEDADAAPPPERAAAALRHLITERSPSGRYQVADLAGAR